MYIQQWEIACGHSCLVKAAFNLERPSGSYYASQDPAAKDSMAKEVKDDLKGKIKAACQKFGIVFLVKITSQTEGRSNAGLGITIS